MKSALIIETPTNCIDCPINYQDKACGKTETSFMAEKDFNPAKGRLKDCPLVALPDAEVANEYDFEHYANGVCIGWNRYRDKLLRK